MREEVTEGTKVTEGWVIIPGGADSDCWEAGELGEVRNGVLEVVAVEFDADPCGIASSFCALAGQAQRQHGLVGESAVCV